MVLGRDLNLAGQQVQYRLVGAAVSEFQLEGLCAARESEELVTQANAENRNTLNQLADGGDRVVERLGVAWAIREENAVRLPFKHFFGAGRARQNGHAAF